MKRRYSNGWNYCTKYLKIALIALNTNECKIYLFNNIFLGAMHFFHFFIKQRI